MQYQERNFFYIISSTNTTWVKINSEDKVISHLPRCPKYKFGITNNIKNRIKWLEKQFNVKDVEIIYLKKYKNAKVLEDYIKGFLYDKWEKQKEWFGQEKSHEGTICELDDILRNIEFFNNQSIEK